MSIVYEIIIPLFDRTGNLQIEIRKQLSLYSLLTQTKIMDGLYEANRRPNVRPSIFQQK